MHHSLLLTKTLFVLFLVSTLTPTAADLFGSHSAPSTHEMYLLLTCQTSLLSLKTDFSLFYGPSVDESICTVTSYVRLGYDTCCPMEKLFIYPNKISFSLLKRICRKKGHYSSLNYFTNVKRISSNNQAEIICLNSIFASRFSNCKPSQLWNNIRSLVLVRLNVT